MLKENIKDRFSKEIAEELNVEIDEVKSILEQFFKTIIEKAISRTVDFFWLRGFGSIRLKGFSKPDKRKCGNI